MIQEKCIIVMNQEERQSGGGIGRRPDDGQLATAEKRNAVDFVCKIIAVM